MKVKLVPTLIIAGIAALIGYGFYAANAGDGNNACVIMMAFSAVTFFVTLAGGFGVSYGTSGASVGIVALSIVMLVVLLVINLIATFVPFRVAPYIVCSGIALLLYVGIAYALAKASAD